MKTLAVIPARGGSTRLKNKNIYPLKGKPLIRWSVETVLDSECFDDVLVSTDSELIWNSVSDLNVTRHQRPQEYATSKATVLTAMIDLMRSIEKEYDIFSYFLPTCPFFSISDIEESLNIFKKDRNVDSVISMIEMQDTVQLACIINNDNVLPIFDNLKAGVTNSKYIQKYYKPSGAFYMARWDKLLEEENFFKGNVKGVVMDKSKYVDINDIFDIKYGELL